MWLRKVFYYVQFWAIPVLPLWLLIARGITIDGSGWELIFLLFTAPALSLALIVVMGLTVARKSVRRSQLLSWLDVGILAAWYASIIFLGLMSNPLVAVSAIVLTLVAFWSTVWQLVVEARQRISLAFASYEAIPVTYR
jgi:hypothetical protein